ncbi:type II secretion system protein [uncultured Tateyamaria sp.]|uniref:type IV pilus modification PilV family protein n=1 Tax=Tateyamaria sp. 1078 TaxID=3417464 RepID=UPI0026093DA1|nr:type II secretion system protein [uncultured Tateyamaria sp.]
MSPRSGYSILEVLVAFAVMSMVLAVLIPGQTQLLVRASQAADRALAHDLALSRLDEAHVLGTLRDETYRDWRVLTETAIRSDARLLTVTVTSAAGRPLAQAQRQIAIPDAD